VYGGPERVVLRDWPFFAGVRADPAPAPIRDKKGFSNQKGSRVIPAAFLSPHTGRLSDRTFHLELDNFYLLYCIIEFQKARFYGLFLFRLFMIYHCFSNNCGQIVGKQIPLAVLPHAGGPACAVEFVCF